MVDLNSLVRQFGLRFHCNGIKQLAKDFLKACHAFHGILPFLPCPLHYALSAPRAHLNGYRLILLISPLARSCHCKRSPISLSYPIRHASSGKVTLQHFLSRTLFGTHHVRGKERTAFLTTGEEKSSYSIFSLVLYSARIMSEVKSVQFSLYQGTKS